MSMTPEARRLIEQHLPWVLAFAIGWPVLGSLVIALLRRRDGLPVFRPERAAAILTETWTSTLRVNNGVWVTVTPDALELGLHFPFSVSMPTWISRRLGSEARVPLERITAIAPRRHVLRGELVHVEYREDGRPRELAFRVRQPAAFVEKLRAAARARGATFSLEAPAR
jgi:hypothetical protein